MIAVDDSREEWISKVDERNFVNLQVQGPQDLHK
jgi:hypothetical protein